MTFHPLVTTVLMETQVTYYNTHALMLVHAIVEKENHM